MSSAVPKKMASSAFPASLSSPPRTCRVMDRSAVFALPRFEDPTIPPIGRRFFVPAPHQILKFGTSKDEAKLTELAHDLLGDKAPQLCEAVCLTDQSITDYGLIISRLPGKPLIELWPSLNNTQRAEVKKRLAELLVFMRKPRQGVNFYGRPNSQPYVLSGSDFKDTSYDYCRTRSEWDSSRIRALHAKSPDTSRERLRALEHVQRTTGATGSPLVDRPVLTHGDLSARNFLVEPGTLELTGIIDWETCNIAPAYFEFAQARLTGGHDPFWRADILEVLEQVLRIECDHAIAQGGVKVKGEALFKETLAMWKALVNVERPAQGMSDKCHWTFEEKDEETRRNWTVD